MKFNYLLITGLLLSTSVVTGCGGGGGDVGGNLVVENPTDTGGGDTGGGDTGGGDTGGGDTGGGDTGGGDTGGGDGHTLPADAEFPIVSFKASAGNEADGAQRKILRITATINQPVSKPEYTVEITYRLNAGLATPDVDFRGTNSSAFTLGVGERQKFIEIDIYPDEVDEYDEDFELEVIKVKNAEVATSTVSLIILDNDPEPTLDFAEVSTAVSEATGRIEVFATLTGLSDREVVAPVAFSGTAGIGADYSVDPTKREFVFQPGDSEAKIELTVLHDDLKEGGETIIIDFDRITYGAVGDKGQTVLIISGDTPLNDTGVTFYTDGTNDNLSSAPATAPGQDADHGRDTDFGFHLTKLDEDGNGVHPSSTSHSCVEDQITGLVWEIHKPFVEVVDPPEQGVDERPHVVYPHTRAANFRYTWYSLDADTNGGAEGAKNINLKANNPQSAECAFQYIQPGSGAASSVPTACNTLRLIEEANIYSMCGSNNWRLPTMEELRSLANIGVSASGSKTDVLDTFYFPNIQEVKNADYALNREPRLLSSDTHPNQTGAVFCLDIETGSTKICKKNTPRAAILVRSDNDGAI